MKLDVFEYVFNQNEPNEWRIAKCELNSINLIVGKNASGKSRIVNAIYLLSRLLSENGTLKPNPRSDELILLLDVIQFASTDKKQVYSSALQY